MYGPAILTVYECIDGQAIPKEYKLSATQMQAIPPHGRLIDADEVPYFASSPWKAIATQSEIEKMPTIIEAEKGANNENL